jgi:wobble nucleotide-excising tRNase
MSTIFNRFMNLMRRKEQTMEDISREAAEAALAEIMGKPNLNGIIEASEIIGDWEAEGQIEITSTGDVLA